MKPFESLSRRSRLCACILGKTEPMLKSLSVSSSLPLKYDLLLGPHNGVRRRTQRMVEKKFKEDKLFSPLKSEVLKC